MESSAHYIVAYYRESSSFEVREFQEFLTKEEAIEFAKGCKGYRHLLCRVEAVAKDIRTWEPA